jgi:hypothetical protein
MARSISSPSTPSSTSRWFFDQALLATTLRQLGVPHLWLESEDFLSLGGEAEDYWQAQASLSRLRKRAVPSRKRTA